MGYIPVSNKHADGGGGGGFNTSTQGSLDLVTPMPFQLTGGVYTPAAIVTHVCNDSLFSNVIPSLSPSYHFTTGWMGGPCLTVSVTGPEPATCELLISCSTIPGVP